eukprot:scaffold51969_cov61-Phaeocystis_antarctica.AAC.1
MRVGLGHRFAAAWVVGTGSCVSVRQTTNLVVRGLGRAFLCLSVCLSVTVCACQHCEARRLWVTVCACQHCEACRGRVGSDEARRLAHAARHASVARAAVARDEARHAAVGGVLRERLAQLSAARVAQVVEDERAARARCPLRAKVARPLRCLAEPAVGDVLDGRRRRRRCCAPPALPVAEALGRPLSLRRLLADCRLLDRRLQLDRQRLRRPVPLAARQAARQRRGERTVDGRGHHGPRLDTERGRAQCKQEDAHAGRERTKSWRGVRNGTPVHVLEIDPYPTCGHHLRPVPKFNHNVDDVAIHHLQLLRCLRLVDAVTVEQEADLVWGDALPVAVGVHELQQRRGLFDLEVDLVAVLADHRELDLGTQLHRVLLCERTGCSAIHAVCANRQLLLRVLRQREHTRRCDVRLEQIERLQVGTALSQCTRRSVCNARIWQLDNLQLWAAAHQGSDGRVRDV